MDKVISIRKATAQDLESVQQFGFDLLDFERKKWDSSLDPKWPFSEIGKQKYLEAIMDKYTILAEVDGKPIGFLIGKIIETPKDSARNIKQARLENIYVVEKFRKSGAGRKMMDEFKHFCVENGVTRIDVSVFAENTAAIEFYKKANFLPRNLTLSFEIK